MPIIKIELTIAAPAERCFDLSRSIELHQLSTQKTGERAIAGVMSGLIEQGQWVTWRAKHLGVWQTLTAKITGYNRPHFFADEMVRGAFKRFRHEHHFREENGVTIMTDIFDYTSPLGVLGKLADWLFLKKYMVGFLHERNRVIKEYAEGEKWRELLPESE